MRQRFVSSINAHQADFGISLSEDTVESLADYYALVQQDNELLHLTAPCSADEFAVRHILESLTLLEFLPQNTRFADVGTGAGLPSIPCLLVRPDLSAILIESKEKKAAFLRSAIEKLNIADRARIENTQFEEVDPRDCGYITCRALDKFTEKLPRLLRWSKKRKLLLFGGNSLELALRKQNVSFKRVLMPLSERRYLFVQ